MYENNLDDLNIFALRDLARRTGVNSPTSKKKDQLIKEILDIMSGKQAPQVSKTKQGRPPKVFGYDFTDVLTKNMALGQGVGLSSQALNQEVVISEEESSLTVAGWIEIGNNNSALIWVERNFRNEHYFVSKDLVSQLPIKNGDRVVAEIGKEENSRVVKKIFSVNDCPISRISKKRKDYADIDGVIPSRSLKFKDGEYSGLNLLFGENVYVYGSDNNLNTIKIVDMINSSLVENKFYLNISLADKNKIYLKKLKNVHKFLSHITDDLNVVKRLVLLTIESAKRVLENGEDVVLIVDDLNSIMGVDKDFARRIVSLAKEAKKGSVTLLSVMPNNDMQLVEKLADKRLKIENNNIEKI